jgi:threonyl-tRNA synthetase
MSKINPQILRHSAAHLLAHAIYRLYPDTLFGIGPATKSGFFYDVVRKDGKNFKQSDLAAISQIMKEIVKENHALTHTLVEKAEGKKIFAHNPFKMDIIENQITDDVVGLAQQGEFTDLCKGGHVNSTGQLNNFILTGISGSYWRALRDGQPMQRISGIIFETADELEAYLANQKDLEQYDHRVIGKEMSLFELKAESPGCPFFLPRGMTILNALTDYMKKITHYYGYQEIKTPTILDRSLWVRSGHYQHYKDNMFFITSEEGEYAVKPMNCPGAFLVFKARPRSYRELPLRLSEFGYVHRNEFSGVLHGLTRVRAFTIDDAHIFCQKKDIEQEVSLVFSLIKKVMQAAGLTVSKVILATRPKKAAGSKEIWDTAEEALKRALNQQNQKYELDEGEGAFYGPKIGIEVIDTFDRVWSCGTIQLDFVQPENFSLDCVNKEGKNERVVVIHQAMFGSFERFLALSLEHHRGKLPLWLSPCQVKLIPFSDEQKSYTEAIYKKLLLKGVRVEIDDSYGDPLTAKIQKAIEARDFLSVIIGKREVEADTLSIRYNYTNKRENNRTLESVINEIEDAYPRID